MPDHAKLAPPMAKTGGLDGSNRCCRRGPAARRPASSLTLGGEPTYVPLLKPTGAEWTVAADGPTKTHLRAADPGPELRLPGSLAWQHLDVLPGKPLTNGGSHPALGVVAG